MCVNHVEVETKTAANLMLSVLGTIGATLDTELKEGIEPSRSDVIYRYLEQVETNTSRNQV